MTITREHSLKMADELCYRIGEAMHEKGLTLQSRVGLMGNMQLSSYTNTGACIIRKQIVVEDFSKWTPEEFQKFEALAIKELT